MFKNFAGFFGPYCVRTGWTSAYFINFADGIHTR